MAVLFVLAVGYLLGSVQPGLLLGRLWRGVDVREYGSGKTGFTNTLRTIGIVPALLVVGLDIAKGVLPVLLGRLVFHDPLAAAMGGVGSVVGHIFPLLAGFRGGRGVATSFGAVFAMAPVPAVFAALTGFAVLGATRYVSVMSMVCVPAGLLAMAYYVSRGWLVPEYLIFGVVVTVAVEVGHLGNLRRLLAGTEPKIGQGGTRRAAGQT